MIKDATADYTDEMMHAALHINIPNYAGASGNSNRVADSYFLPRCGSFIHASRLPLAFIFRAFGAGIDH